MSCAKIVTALWDNTSLANQHLGHGDFSFIDLAMYICTRNDQYKSKTELTVQ